MRSRPGSRGRVRSRRRPGSSGRVLPTLLLGAFTLVGLVGTWAVAMDWARTVDSYRWPETECTVLASSVEVPERADDEFVFTVSYRYRHGGRLWFGDRYRFAYHGSDDSAEAYRLAERFPAGAVVPCWIDPDEPDSAFLEHRSLAHGLLVFIPLVFALIGGGGLWLLWRTSSGDGGGGSAGKVSSKEASKRAAKALGERFDKRGSGCLAGFFSIFLLAGLGLLWLVLIGPALSSWRARSWVGADCEVVASHVATHSGEDSDTYSVEILYRYTYGGREYHSNRYHFFSGSTSGYESKARVVEAHPAGHRFTCWVDPDEPSEAVVARGLGAQSWIAVVPLVFVAAGGGGVVWALAGRRRKRRVGYERTARRRRSRPKDTPLPAAGGPVTLERAHGPVKRLLGLLFVTVFWNGIVGLFVWQFVQEWRAGSPDGCLAIFLVPFVGIGLLLVVSIPYSILALANPRPHLTLDPGAVPPGGEAEVRWRFSGAAGRLRELAIRLEAEEKATERTGSKTSTRTTTVFTQPVYETDRSSEIPAGSARFTLDPEAPPTSRGGDRGITWKLEVAGTIRFWPDVAEAFEVEVPPPAFGDGGPPEDPSAGDGGSEDEGPPIPAPDTGWSPPPAPIAPE